MGASNGVTRGQLRPHFAGRNPPFVVAALCVGLAILGVSYWSLCTQYNDLEEQLKTALQRKESIENDENVVKKQLHLREDEFSRVKVNLQKKEQELEELNNQLKAKATELTVANSKMDSLQLNVVKCNEDLSKKENQIGDMKTKLNELQNQNNKVSQLKDEEYKQFVSVKLENENLKKQLNDVNKNALPAVNAIAGNVSNSLPSIDSKQSLLSPPLQTNGVDGVDPKNTIVRPQLEPPGDAVQQLSVQNANKDAIKAVASLGDDDKKEDDIVDAGAPDLTDDLKEPNRDDEESKDGQI